MESKLKTYKILKTVQGSRDGIKVDTFKKGETHELDEHLAEQLYHQGAVEEVTGGKKADGGRNPADGRATKVTGPAETKVVTPESTKQGEAGVPLGTQHIEELVAVARDKYGLDVDSTMGEADLKAAIEAAESGEEVDEDEIPSRSDPLTSGDVAKKVTTDGKKADKAKAKK